MSTFSSAAVDLEGGSTVPKNVVAAGGPPEPDKRVSSIVVVDTGSRTSTRSSTAALAEGSRMSIVSLSRQPTVINETTGAVTAKPTLDNVLATDALHLSPWEPESFLKFLRQDRCEENVLFYWEVEALKSISGKTKSPPPPQELLLLPPTARVDALTHYEGIAKAFIKEGGPHQVNISSDQRKKIAQSDHQELIGLIDAQVGFSLLLKYQ
jgi:hypothetical protein